MMSRVGRVRSRGVVLVLVAMVASLLAVPVVPVRGIDGEADRTPSYSACVGPALESAGFTDLHGYSDETKDAIDCLAHYNITHGTSTGTTNPTVR